VHPLPRLGGKARPEAGKLISAVTTTKFTHHQIGQAYGLTRQRVCELVQEHGFDAVIDPSVLFVKLLEAGNSSALRTALSDPDFRREVRHKLMTTAPNPHPH
jgi:hypothetical protein